MPELDMPVHVAVVVDDLRNAAPTNPDESLLQEAADLLELQVKLVADLRALSLSRDDA